MTEESKLTEKIKQARKTKHANETNQDKARRYVIGPFQFLAFSLIASESILVYWMSQIFTKTSTNYFHERIVVGSLSIAILIAVLVVFCVVYSIKKKRGDCEH